MSFFYKHPSDYKAHMTHEGELMPPIAHGRPPTTPMRIFQWLSGAGRLVRKDVLLPAGAWQVMADSARTLLATGVTCGRPP